VPAHAGRGGQCWRRDRPPSSAPTSRASRPAA
jgi:hypothetical protein